MSNYGTMKVMMYFVNSRGQNQKKTLESRHYVSIEEAKDYVLEVRQNNPKLEGELYAEWQMDPVKM